MRGDTHDQDVGARDNFGHVASRVQRRRQFDAGQIFAVLIVAVDAVNGFLESLKLGVALHRDAKGFEAFDQQPFVFVLGEYFEEGVRRQALADVGQRQACHGFTLDPEIGGLHAMALLHDTGTEVELAVQLQRPCLHGQRPRCGAGRRRLVDNPHADPQRA